MIRHIFCDLDGTLYNNGINEDDVKAIKEIEKEGVIFHVATGRVFKQAYKMINEKFKLNGYFICENGSFIFDKDKNLIFKEPLDDYLVRKIINTFDSNSSHIYLKYDGNIVLSGGADIFNYYSGEINGEGTHLTYNYDGEKDVIETTGVEAVAVFSCDIGVNKKEYDIDSKIVTDKI